MNSFLSNRKSLKFMTQVAVIEGSPIVGRKALEVDLFRRRGMRIVDVLRGDASLRRDLQGVSLEAGDIVVLRTGVNELLTLRESRALAMVDQISSTKTATVEALIGPDCRMIGRTLGRLRLRRRYGVYPLALHRRSQRVAARLDDVIVKVGDTLLLEGDPEDIRRLAADVNLVDLAEPFGSVLSPRPGAHRPRRAGRGRRAFGARLNLDRGGGHRRRRRRASDALHRSRRGVRGYRRQASGADLRDACDRAGDPGLRRRRSDRLGLAPLLVGLAPWLALWCVYIMASVMTELVSNAAVAVVVTPIAVTLAGTLGADPRPFVVAVMLAASLSFATPIGYQTNTMVFAPGGYRFSDFLRLGLPLNLGLGLIAAALIPLFWPL